MDFPDIMEAYLLDPTPAHRNALRAAVIASPGYDPMVSLAQVLAGPTRASGTPEEAARAGVDAIWAQMPGLFLSPQAHARLARGYRTLGQDTDADREEKLAVLAFDSIRAGRDGSEQSPFEVLRVADEYDVLSSSGLRSTGQELRPTDYGEADVHTLAGGGELWFRLLWRDAPTA
ncbi:MAG TPA: hypothetical protein VK122_05505 [Brachybacterium sp.]|nr:hypothetical protein [Brachybacterium sp.]